MKNEATIERPKKASMTMKDQRTCGPRWCMAAIARATDPVGPVSESR